MKKLDEGSKLYRFHLGTEDLIYNGPFKDHTSYQKKNTRKGPSL